MEQVLNVLILFNQMEQYVETPQAHVILEQNAMDLLLTVLLIHSFQMGHCVKQMCVNWVFKDCAMDHLQSVL